MTGWQILWAVFYQNYFLQISKSCYLWLQSSFEFDVCLQTHSSIASTKTPLKGSPSGWRSGNPLRDQGNLVDIRACGVGLTLLSVEVAHGKT